MNEKFKMGQILYIDGIKHAVINMIEFKEGKWIWQEYEIVNQSGKHRWLSSEFDEEDNTTEYWLYEDYFGRIKEQENKAIVNNEEYDLYEQGTTVVKSYFGNADVDLGEKCNYIDYISKDKKHIISIEKWVGEIERTKGELIDNSRIQITNEIDPAARKSTKVGKTIIGVFTCFFVLFTIIPMIAVGLGTNKSMMKYLEKSTSKYTYVTSVTNNTNNKIAKVYKSSLSTIDATVKDIIDGAPEGITQTIDEDPSTEEDGIGLHTNSEFAYIYKDDGIVFVQVSEKEYVKENGSTYHRSHGTHYYSTFRSSKSSSIYSSYSQSARQKSINSRKSSGGGTSSGK